MQSGREGSGLKDGGKKNVVVVRMMAREFRVGAPNRKESPHHAGGTKRNPWPLDPDNGELIL